VAAAGGLKPGDTHTHFFCPLAGLAGVFLGFFCCASE
jgi:hypothetical protein